VCPIKERVGVGAVRERPRDTPRSCSFVGDAGRLTSPKRQLAVRRAPITIASPLGRRTDEKELTVLQDLKTTADGESPLRVAYITSRFPKLTETFVLYEILGLQRHGVRVDLYPLLRERTKVMHPEAAAVVAQARFLPFVSPAILRSQLWFLRHRPRAYLGALRDLLRGTWGSLNFFVGAVGIFPKVAHVARRAEADGVDHVHCHFATHPAAAGFVIHRLTGIPYSFTAQGSDLHVDRRMLPEKVAEAAFAVPISRYNRDIILRECGGRFGDKLEVIHSGIDTAFFSARNGSRAAAGPLSITCVGTLHEVKGQAYLIEACRLLARHGVDFVCRLVGDGPDRGALEDQIAAAGLEGRVSLLGPRPRGEVAELMAASDVLVAPSVPTRQGKREGIPIVLMEALASGLPVVASRLAGIPELVEDGRTGLLVEPRDAAGLAAALRRLSDDPALRAQLAAAGRAKVELEFDAYDNAARLAARCARAARAAAAA
jgi:glycosyltransferase involved in cell wall biosynthesis